MNEKKQNNNNYYYWIPVSLSFHVYIFFVTNINKNSYDTPKELDFCTIVCRLSLHTHIHSIELQKETNNFFFIIELKMASFQQLDYHLPYNEILCCI